MKWQSYFRCGLASSANILLNAFSGGRYLWLEGRVRRGRFRNWTRGFAYVPAAFAAPETEAELIELVKRSRKLRVFGAGHSFNAGIQSEETLVSLDKFSGFVSKDLAKKQMTFKGGSRVRDAIACLKADGLAFAALPSHDAQSLAGILSTDVHGTGRDWGFVSESVVKLKLIDGNGEVIECTPEDELFQAAIGGVGAVGIISEVTVQGVDRFRVEKKAWKSDLATVERDLEQLIEANDHLSVYLSPFTDRCLINSWNRTTKRKSRLGRLRKFIGTAADALLAAWIGNLMAYTGLFPRLASVSLRLKQGSSLVMESNDAFSRAIYHRHQELEFSVPFEDSVVTWRQFKALYESIYSRAMPYMLIELRFTPAGHERSLIGPGHGRRSTWIDLVINDSDRYEAYFQAAEAELMKIGARPHLGKYVEDCDVAYLAGVHGERFATFRRLREKHDPHGKFANPFTRQLFAA